MSNNSNWTTKQEYSEYLQKKRHKDDPDILVQLYTSARGCSCGICAYEDHLVIDKTGNKVVDGGHAIVSYDEVEDIGVAYAGSILLSGTINIAYMPGTRYYKYCTLEHKENKNLVAIEPDEIPFDVYSRQIVYDRIDKISVLIRKYKKEKERQEREFSASRVYNFNGSFTVKDGCINFGNFSISVDNSIGMTVIEISREIGEKGGEDKEELYQTLQEVQELLEQLKKGEKVPRNEGLFKKIVNHADKHGWFYAEIISLIGSVVLKVMGG